MRACWSDEVRSNKVPCGHHTNQRTAQTDQLLLFGLREIGARGPGSKGGGKLDLGDGLFQGGEVVLLERKGKARLGRCGATDARMASRETLGNKEQ